jgi:hypothetical protein
MKFTGRRRLIRKYGSFELYGIDDQNRQIEDYLCRIFPKKLAWSTS